MNRISLSVLCLALSCAAALPPEGAVSSRNLVNATEKGITDTFSAKKGKQKNIKWQEKLGSVSNSGPVVAGGRIYIGTNNDRPRDPKIRGDRGVLMCFDEATGKFLWQITHDKLPGGDTTDCPSQGIASAPFVQDGTLWYVSNRCEIVCADARAGKIKWTVDMVKDYDVFPCQLANSSPLVVGEVVYALTGNGVNIRTGKVAKPKAPSIVAVDKTTGKPRWAFTCQGPVMRGQWSSPTAAVVGGKTQILAACGDGWLYGLSADKGELLWKFDLNPKKATPYKPGGSGEKSFPIGIPVVVEGKCYIACGQEPDDGSGVGHLWCIDITKKPTNAEKDLSPVGDDFDPKSAKNKDSGLVWHYGGKLAKPREDGRDFDFGRTLGTVAVHDGLVYATEIAGFLHCLDAKTGKKQWEHDFVEGTWCSPYYVDGKVYVGTESGDLHVFQAGRKHAPPRKNAATGQIKIPPVASRGVLYLNCSTTLIAIK